MRPPTRPATSAGTNQAVMPGPVAIASQTSSGVPGTSTSRRRTRSSGRSLMGWLRGIGGGAGVRGHDEAVPAPALRGLVVVTGSSPATAVGGCPR